MTATHSRRTARVVPIPFGALERLHACSDAMDWLRGRADLSWQAAWYDCERGDWMAWLLATLAADRRPLQPQLPAQGNRCGAGDRRGIGR